MDDTGKQRLFSDYNRLSSAFEKALDSGGLELDFSHFVRDRCILGNDTRVGATAFFMAFREYCNEKGLTFIGVFA